MKKTLLIITMLIASLSAQAQFEKGKKYVNASLASAGLSYSDYTKFALGFSAEAGYFIDDDWMALAEVGFDYRNSNVQQVYVGAKGRYYIEQNGLFLGAGARLLHEYKGHNDFQLNPEVGYCFFVNKHLTIEPVVYFDMSLSDFSNNSKVGLKFGLGYYF